MFNIFISTLSYLSAIKKIDPLCKWTQRLLEKLLCSFPLHFIRSLFCAFYLSSPPPFSLSLFLWLCYNSKVHKTNILETVLLSDNSFIEWTTAPVSCCQILKWNKDRPLTTDHQVGWFRYFMMISCCFHYYSSITSALIIIFFNF